MNVNALTIRCPLDTESGGGVGVLCFLSYLLLPISANVSHLLSTPKSEHLKAKAVERGGSRSPSTTKPARPGQQQRRPRGGKPQGTTASGSGPGTACRSTAQWRHAHRGTGPALSWLLPPRAFPPPGGSEERLPAPWPAGRGRAAGREARAARPGQSQHGEARARPCALEHARTHARTYACWCASANFKMPWLVQSLGTSKPSSATPDARPNLGSGQWPPSQIWRKAAGLTLRLWLCGHPC